MEEMLELLGDVNFGFVHLELDETPVVEEGVIGRVNFKRMMHVGKATPDGRFFELSGFSIMPLPLPLLYKDRTTVEPGHHAARLAGSLREASLGEDGVVSGRGVIIDNEAGRDLKLALKTRSIRGTSADLRECIASSQVGLAHGVRIGYSQSKLAGVTVVPVPAFGDCEAELEEDALVASASIQRDLRPPRDAFRNPRLNKKTGIRVVPLNSEFHQVFGHLALFDVPHSGFQKYTPCPTGDDFSKFYSGGNVLCDDGTYVPVGRIFLGGDHADTRWKAQQALDHYAATSVAWADIRVGYDQFGVWFSGVTRPGLTQELVYEARASSVSGDWRKFDGRRKLIAVLSTNVAGFPIEEDGVELEDCALVASVAAPTLEDVEEPEVDTPEPEVDPVVEEPEVEVKVEQEAPQLPPLLIKRGLFDPIQVRGA